MNQIEVPRDAVALSTLRRIDYADAFLVTTDAHPQRTAEQWGRAVLEQAPATTRAQLRAGWTWLGLKVGGAGHEPAHSILGWRLRLDTPEAVLLGADSRIGMPGELLFAVRPRGLLFATFIHHRTPATRPLWRLVEDTHVRVVGELLDRAAYGVRGSAAAPEQDRQG